MWIKLCLPLSCCIFHPEYCGMGALYSCRDTLTPCRWVLDLCSWHRQLWGHGAPKLCKVQVPNSGLTARAKLIRDELEGPFQARMEPFCNSEFTGEMLIEFPSLVVPVVFLYEGVVVVARWLVAGRGFPAWHPGEEWTPQLWSLSLNPCFQAWISFPEKPKVGVHLFKVTFLGWFNAWLSKSCFFFPHLVFIFPVCSVKGCSMRFWRHARWFAWQGGALSRGK